VPPVSWSDDEDPFERPSEWFRHVDDGGGEDHERPRLPDVLAAAAMLTILVVVLVSVLQAVILHERSDDLPDDEFERTALLFGASVLQRRSTGQALILAADDADEDVQEIMRMLSNAPDVPIGSSLAIRPAPCTGPDEAAEQCYEATLIHDGTEIPPGMYFGLARVDGEPRIVFARSTLQSAHLRSSRILPHPVSQDSRAIGISALNRPWPEALATKRRPPHTAGCSTFN
jgi:hypothetical protein